jgi:hypothetical protein
MGWRKLRAVAGLLGWIILACLLPGCQFSYQYEVRGTIRDFAGGTPLTGVHVSLKEGPAFVGDPMPAITGNDGSFILRFRVSDIEFPPGTRPKWSLSLAKDNYTDEVIDIGPFEEPESAKTTNLVVVSAYMRAKGRVP